MCKKNKSFGHLELCLYERHYYPPKPVIWSTNNELFLLRYLESTFDGDDQTIFKNHEIDKLIIFTTGLIFRHFLLFLLSMLLVSLIL